MPSVSGGGSCGGEWRNGFWVLEMGGGEWMAVRVDVRIGRVGLFEARRLMRLFGKSGAMVMVMRLLGGSFLRWCGGNVMVA